MAGTFSAAQLMLSGRPLSSTSTTGLPRNVALHAMRPPSRAATAAEALGLSGTYDWDIVLLDLYLPDSSGLDSLSNFRKQFPKFPMIVMTSLDDEDLVIAARLLSPEEDLLLVSKKAQALRFRANDEVLRPMGRATSGVTSSACGARATSGSATRPAPRAMTSIASARPWLCRAR